MSLRFPTFVHSFERPDDFSGRPPAFVHIPKMERTRLKCVCGVVFDAPQTAGLHSMKCPQCGVGAEVEMYDPLPI